MCTDIELLELAKLLISRNLFGNKINTPKGTKIMEEL